MDLQSIHTYNEANFVTNIAMQSSSKNIGKLFILKSKKKLPPKLDIKKFIIPTRGKKKEDVCMNIDKIVYGL